MKRKQSQSILAFIYKLIDNEFQVFYSIYKLSTLRRLFRLENFEL
jgi:hypothetical protein